MDPLTHTLTGAVLSRSGLRRWFPQATPLLLLAANAPDVDIVTAFWGAATYLHYHRHITHALAAVPVLAWAPVLLVRLLTRRPFLWKRAYLVSLLGVITHPLLDWTNMYGIRLLLPFRDDWLRLDITSVVDVWIWAALLAALAGPALGRLVSTEIGARPGSGRTAAILALGFLLVYNGGRWVLHRRAVAVLESRIYDGGLPLRVAAFPEAINPFRWYGLVEGQSYYAAYGVDLLGDFDPADRRVFYKPEPPRVQQAALQTQAFWVFTSFSQFPLWRFTPLDDPPDGWRVEAMDLRFGLPPAARFVATAIVDGAGRVRQAWFSFGPRRRDAARR